MDDEIRIDIGDDIKNRIEHHFELMDKHALAHLRAAPEFEFILTQALGQRFVNEISVGKVVGDSFARLVSLAYALGVISQKTYESLNAFKDIRNRIAHKANPEIKLKDSLAMLKFLGSKKTAEEALLEKGSYLAAWHQAALELLRDHFRSEVIA